MIEIKIVRRLNQPIYDPDTGENLGYLELDPQRFQVFKRDKNTFELFDMYGKSTNLFLLCDIHKLNKMKVNK